MTEAPIGMEETHRAVRSIIGAFAATDSDRAEIIKRFFPRVVVFLAPGAVVTRDYRPDRIRVTVSDGIVTAASVG